MGGIYRRYTQGGMGGIYRVYTTGCTQGGIYQGVYLRVYQGRVYQGGVYLRVYLGCIPGWYIPQGVPQGVDSPASRFEAGSEARLIPVSLLADTPASRVSPSFTRFTVGLEEGSLPPICLLYHPGRYTPP